MSTNFYFVLCASKLFLSRHLPEKIVTFQPKLEESESKCPSIAFMDIILIEYLWGEGAESPSDFLHHNIYDN